MALAQYTDKFWYPSGTLAVGVAVRVFPVSSNILAPLFSDATGTNPLANPLTTDGNGGIAFYAEEGEYWLHADSESFRVSVGVPEFDVREVAAATLSTGIVSGGDITPNALSSSAIDISPFVAYITDFTLDPFVPDITRISFPGVTGIEMDAGSLARTVTSWMMDADQNITQIGSPSTNAQRRTHVLIGITAQVGGVIIVDQSLPVILQQPANQFSDLMAALGPFSIDGNRITPNGVNLQVNQSSGRLWSQAFNHFVGPVQTNDPHVSTTIAQVPASFRYTTRNSPVFGPLRTTIDVANYDVGGVITPIGGGANTSTIHRVYMFPNNTAADQIVVQYGQTTYSSLANAVAAIGAGTFTPHPLMLNAALLGYIAVIRTATDLSSSTQALIVHAGKFATP